MLIYTVRCLYGFRDGNVFDRRINPGEVMDVSEGWFKRMRQSDPDTWEVLETRVPPSTRGDAESE